MSQIEQDDCVSRKPWGEVLSRSLKLFTFNAAREGGRSFGRVIFYFLLAVIVVFIASYIIDSMTGWFGNLFDFWPFGGGADEAEPEKTGWFDWSNKDGAPAATPEVKWYCKFNPVC